MGYYDNTSLGELTCPAIPKRIWTKLLFRGDAESWNCVPERDLARQQFRAALALARNPIESKFLRQRSKAAEGKKISPHPRYSSIITTRRPSPLPDNFQSELNMPRSAG